MRIFHLIRTLAVCLLFLSTPPLALAEARLALVIGNAAYRSETLGPLNNPVKDAKAIAQMLQRLGFEVMLHTDVTKKAFGMALQAFEERLARQPGQVGLVFYSGHGLRGTDANNYLLPVDANPNYQEDLEWEGIPVERVLKEMEAAKPRMSLLIIDACRNTTLRSRHKGTGEQGMQIMQAPSGSLIAFATAPNQKALDYVLSGDSHSPFVAALLEHLPKSGLTVEQVFKETRKTVLAKTKNEQTPWENSSLLGDFYFAPPVASPQPMEPSRVPSSLPTKPVPAERPAPIAGEGALETAEAAFFDLNNRRAALAWYQQAATEGNPIAKAVLAEWTQEGTEGLAKSPTEAQRLAKEALPELQTLARQGDPRAQYRLGNFLSEGVGVTRDEPLSVAWYRKAAEQGYVIAQNALGFMYGKGRGVANDDKEAVNWYRKAAKQRYAPAQYNLGLMYEQGRGVAKDDKEAAVWYRKAAERGDANAKYKVGLLYEKQGDTDAQYKLGLMYEQGRGVAKDDTEAVKWFRKAAEQGNVTAMYNLSVRYEQGRGVAKDDTEAVKWFRKAAEQGNSDAQFNLGVMYGQGRGVAKDDKEAAAWYRKAAEQRYAAAQYNLGLMYEQGRGVAKDDKEAAVWYRKAAEQGDVKAQARLDLIYTVKPSENSPPPKVAERSVTTSLWDIFDIWVILIILIAVWADLISVLESFISEILYKNKYKICNIFDILDKIRLIIYVTFVLAITVKALMIREFFEEYGLLACLILLVIHLLFKEKTNDEVFFGIIGFVYLVCFTIFLFVAELAPRRVSFLDAVFVYPLIFISILYLFVALTTIIERTEIHNKWAWLRKAAEQGDADAQRNLGYKLCWREGVTEDEKKEAVTWFRKAAEQGNTEAQRDLGYMYNWGRGVAKDDKEAAAWFRRAAEQGDSDAQYRLGFMYELGDRIAKDRKEAAAWYRKAAEQGNKEAKSKLSDLKL